MSVAPSLHPLQRLFYALGALVLLFVVLVWGQALLVPLLLGLMLAFLLLPPVHWLIARRVPRALAIVLSLLLVLVVLLGLLFLIGSQLVAFANSLPTLGDQLAHRLEQLQQFIDNTFGISPALQEKFIREKIKGATTQLAGLLFGLFGAAGSFIASLGIVVVFGVLFALYVPRFHAFLRRLLPPSQDRDVLRILDEVSHVTARYVAGLALDILILAILGSIGYSLLGLPYAILLALLAAMLNVIPYIGVFIGSVLPILVALLMKDSLWYPVGALGVAIVVQALDNNFIMPLVVGRSVSLNPLTTILALLLGGLVWGVAGMVLFVPLVGMVRIALHHFPATEPWAWLMGEATENPPAATPPPSQPQ